MTIGEKIKELRRRQGLTQQELSKVMELDDASIRRYESNRLKARASMIQRFSDAFNVAPEALIASDMDAIKAMHSLFAIFKLYGGKFKKVDDEIALDFEALKPFINEWYEHFSNNDEQIDEWLDKYPASSSLPDKYIELIKTLDQRADNLDNKKEVP